MTDSRETSALSNTAPRKVVGTKRFRESMPQPISTRIFTVANQKGGVGKTTSAVNVAAALAMGGLRTLIIDLDPQGNASTAFGIARDEVQGMYEVITKDLPIQDAALKIPGFPHLEVVPATQSLANAEVELVPMVARELRLKKALTNYLSQAANRGERFDYVIIDCPPSLGLLTLNALVAAKEVLIPIQTEYYALEGLGQLMNNVNLVKKQLNPELEVATIVLTMFDSRTNLSQQVAEEVRKHFGDIVITTEIPRAVRVSEAPSFQQTVITYDPGSPGAQAYVKVAKEFAQRHAGAN